MKYTITLIVDPTAIQVNYTTDSLRSGENEPISPFASLATPQAVKELDKTHLKFRSGLPDFIQSPYGVTEKGGIVYLKDWGPQAYPCDDICPPL